MESFKTFWLNWYNNETDRNVSENIPEELYTQMCTERDPPTMNEFPPVYARALNILQEKVLNEEEAIKIFEQNNTKLNDMLNSESLADKKDEGRKFVFRVNQIEGVYDRNPKFRLIIEDSETIEIEFKQFEEGDAIVSLPMSSNSIKVQVYSENGTFQFEFIIDLGIFGDKRRQQNNLKIHNQKGEEIAIEYEGQIIYNQVDYKRGLLFLNSTKIEQSKADKYVYSKLRDDLLSFFKDNNLSASVMGNPTQRQSAHLTGSQYEIIGNVPVLKSNPLKSSFVPQEIATRESKIGQINSKDITEMGVYSSGAKPKSAFYNYVPEHKLDWNFFVHVLFFVCLLLLLVSFLVNWDRASFLSMFLAIVYVTWYLLKEEFDSLLPPIFLLIGFLIAFGLDLTWIIFCSKGLWNTPIYIHDGSLNGMDKFMIIMSYLLIGLEIAAVVISGILIWRGMFSQKLNPPKQPIIFRLN